MANNSETNTPALNKGRGFLHEVWTELKKTSWPTLEEAWRLTVVVLGVIVAVALYIGVIDTALSKITTTYHIIN
jgi:preprotein translocase subunit SecE